MVKMSIFLFGMTIGLAMASASLASESLPVTHDVLLDSCHFSLSDPYGGDVDLDNESSVHAYSYIKTLNSNAKHSVETSIIFTCEKKHGEKALAVHGLVPPKSNGGWGLQNNSSNSSGGSHRRLYQLEGNGWTGAGVTDQQTTGDVKGRIVSFAFCIRDASQTLCGTSENVGLSFYPDESSLPKVIKLINGIKFIDN